MYATVGPDRFEIILEQAACGGPGSAFAMTALAGFCHDSAGPAERCLIDLYKDGVGHLHSRWNLLDAAGRGHPNLTRTSISRSLETLHNFFHELPCKNPLYAARRDPNPYRHLNERQPGWSAPSDRSLDTHDLGYIQFLSLAHGILHIHGLDDSNATKLTR